MNLDEKVVFGFVVLLAATLNFGFFVGDLSDPTVHHGWGLGAAVGVNVVATVMKLRDRTPFGATHLATSLVARCRNGLVSTEIAVRGVCGGAGTGTTGSDNNGTSAFTGGIRT
jgi:hypothetical protein